MVKRTLYFGNPAYLSLHLQQLLIKLPEVERNTTLPDVFKADQHRTIPLEDIGIVVLDHPRITLSQALMSQLMSHQCVLVCCNDQHLPISMMVPSLGNTTFSERFQAQIDASIPLKKQLWQQTVAAKIENQARVLQHKNIGVKNMLAWAQNVKSADRDNLEARAAVYYWAELFREITDFTRGRDQIPPNNLLNYGYAILRAIVARCLVVSGLNTTIGIYHHNKYNAYCLADDIMEPYRPYVDRLVTDIVASRADINTLSKELKIQLLAIPTLDVQINGQRSPLQVAVAQTTASLAKCYLGTSRKIIYPIV